MFMLLSLLVFLLFPLCEGGKCGEFSVGKCHVPEGDILDTQVFPDNQAAIHQCQLLCLFTSDCHHFRLSHNNVDGICSLLSSMYFESCNEVAGRVEPSLEECQDQENLVPCDRFIKEDCEYHGNVAQAFSSIKDPTACQDLLETFGPIFGEILFKYDSEVLENNCELLDSAEKTCTTISGPNEPAYEECFLDTTTSITASTTTTTSISTSTTATTSIAASTTTTTSIPASGDVAIILGGHPYISGHIQVWSPSSDTFPTSIADFPGIFFNGFLFSTPNHSLIAIDDTFTIIWSPIYPESWTIVNGPPEDMNYPNGAILSDGTTALFLPNGADSYGGHMFNEQSGWFNIESNVEQRCEACTVALHSHHQVLLIGGMDFIGQPSRHAILLNEQGRVIGELPDLNTGRVGHSCSQAIYQGQKGILVVGGRGSTTTEQFSSVEFLSYPHGVSWISLPALPHGVYGAALRPLNSIPYLFGGNTGNDEYDVTNAILEFQTNDGSWKQVGQMLNGAYGHGVAIVNI